MKKVFMVHGFRGEPNGGWRPWLMRELAKIDIYACSLPMPTPDEPVMKEWTNTISNNIGEPNEEIFLVGHSLGVPAILRYLETLQTNQRIGGVVLVSGVIHKIPKDIYKSVNSFLEIPFNFDKIKNVCNNFSIIHGDDDPNVSFKEAEELSQIFNCNLISIPNGKHLNGSAGIYELPEVLEVLKKII